MPRQVFDTPYVKTLIEMVLDIKMEERQQESAQRRDRRGEWTLTDPCDRSPTGAHHWKYKTSSAHSPKWCLHCGDEA